ncbi:VWA domain-containing protein [Amorphus sp. 3PC139-8]|uniref:vWA domain-containing protein n=1 Tax=Amorphus sp. 3PC139-8 TaxID=2735676 RepID=UPI00345CC12B
MTADTPPQDNANTPPEASGKLLDNLVHFARILRAAGIPVGPARVLEAARALEAAGVERRDDFYWTLHSVLVSKREHHVVFDEAFHQFWRTRGLLEKMIELLSPVAPPQRSEPKAKAGSLRVSRALNAGQERKQETERPEVEIDARQTVSGSEVLQAKDFAQMTAEEIAEAKIALRKLVLPLDTVKTRRFTQSTRGRRVDMRRSMRQSLRGGGQSMTLAFKARREIAPPIVALFDISGSMSPYSRLLLHFLHALGERRRVTTFLFGTRLTNVTRQLRMKDPDEALIACADSVEDWSGGTRIAAALHTFNRLWSRRVMHGGPIVLLVTDGLERESDEDLAKEMDRLHRSCRRLIWLNPLLRYDQFQAKARGIRAMLPHVDEFRSIHSLDTVADLVAALGREGASLDTDPRHWITAA